MANELNRSVAKAQKTVKSSKSSKSSKLTTEQFTVKAIETLRTSKSTGIHIVYSGYLAAFRQYFNLDKNTSRLELEKLVASEKFRMVNCKGGAMLFKADDFKDRAPAERKSAALNKILS